MTDREHDLVLYGATGFVGRLTAEHLARSAPDGARIALGGRSRSRLEATRAALPARAADWPLVVADAADPAAVQALAASTTAVATTVGPYVKFGVPLVQACARAGTHYADLTGEVLFVRTSIDTAHDDAVASGARIVHACGFDSVPSDLSVLLAAEQARADDAGELTDTVLCVTSMRGGVSGGTLDSLRTQVDEVKADAAKRRVAADPHSLSPDRSAEADDEASDLFLARREPLLDGRWVAPFVMAPFNTRIVRRSNALADHGYGKGFRYREVMGVGSSPFAPALAAGDRRRGGRGRCRPGRAAHPLAARPRAACPGRGPERARPRDRALPGRDDGADHQRRRLPQHRRGQGRPRVRGHRRHARPGGPVARARRPAAGRRRPHPRHGPRHPAGRPAAGRGLHPRCGAGRRPLGFILWQTSSDTSD